MSAIWIITDDKPGHVSQSLGLLNALTARKPQLQVESLPPVSKRHLIRVALTSQLPEILQSKAQSNPPRLLVAAGHSTHLSLLVLSRRLKARSVVLMQPSLPYRWFDLCLIPQHDHPCSAENIVVTKGALNPLRPGIKRSNTGLILIGGPSKHHAWSDDQLCAQLEQLLALSSCQWVMTSSRRTPTATVERLQDLHGVEFIPFGSTPAGWVIRQLGTAEQAWVTADSVSMLYEALTAGCAVGVLEVPVQRPDRLTRGINALAEAGTITLFSQWLKIRELCPSGAFNEADRCANIILQRGWL